MSKITEYFKDTRAEFRHVNWPTRRQTIVFTALVLVISAVVAYSLGLFDYIFSQLLGKIIIG